jgi:hypothetical protein
MIVGFTGTREGLTDRQDATLDMLANAGEFGGENHHGDCVGADEEFDYFARRYSGSVVIHPPTDDRLRAFCHLKEYGWDDLESVKVLEEKPYLERNRDIADACELLIAIPKQQRLSGFGDDMSDTHLALAPGGTWYTIRYALKRGKPVMIIWPDGSIDRR